MAGRCSFAFCTIWYCWSNITRFLRLSLKSTIMALLSSLSKTAPLNDPVISQVGSHYHFIETNPYLVFDRAAAYGMRLNIAAGTAVRFEVYAISRVWNKYRFWSSCFFKRDCSGSEALNLLRSYRFFQSSHGMKKQNDAAAYKSVHQACCVRGSQQLGCSV